MKSGVINSSLFAAIDNAGVPDSVATQIVDILASEIDFHRDLRKGDRFTVVYDSLYGNGEPARPGRVLAVEFVNQGTPHRALYFAAENGESGYFTPDGKSLRKAFLRSPLEFSRISSGFSSARFHPILKTWRAHNGIDYAAPTGTRVKAAADGTVAFAGWQGGYGNVVILQHKGATLPFMGIYLFSPRVCARVSMSAKVTLSARLVRREWQPARICIMNFASTVCSATPRR